MQRDPPGGVDPEDAHMTEVHTLLVPGVFTGAPLLPPLGPVDELRREALLRRGAQLGARISCGEKKRFFFLLVFAVFTLHLSFSSRVK